MPLSVLLRKMDKLTSAYLRGGTGPDNGGRAVRSVLLSSDARRDEDLGLLELATDVSLIRSIAALSSTSRARIDMRAESDSEQLCPSIQNVFMEPLP